jgi:hypothetical protein
MRTDAEPASMRSKHVSSGSLQLECEVAELVRVQGLNSHEFSYETIQLQRSTRPRWGVSVAHDDTVWATTMYPFTLLRIAAVR